MDRREQLRRELSGHHAADAREAGFRDAMLRLLDAPGDPFLRRRFDPGHFTASAFVMGPGGATLLMIDHRRLGRWLQPGGHIEAGDADLLAAARREVVEEAGLAATELVPCGKGPFDLDIHGIPAGGREPEHRHYDVRFLFRARATRLAAGSEVKAARWVPCLRLTELGGEAALERVARKIAEIGSGL